MDKNTEFLIKLRNGLELDIDNIQRMIDFEMKGVDGYLDLSWYATGKLEGYRMWKASIQLLQREIDNQLAKD